MVITEGTLIRCVLQTAINSDLPGLVDCVVPNDIRGLTGGVVLLDRGTEIVGQIQSSRRRQPLARLERLILMR